MTPWSFQWSQTVPGALSVPAPNANHDADLLNQLGFLPGLKEILTLRQVHALEHATVWLLTQTPQRYPSTQLVGGMSTDRGFYLYGQVEDSDLRQAVAEALERITRGEWNLAIHPECGTNLSVGLLLALGLTLGLAAGLPKTPLVQLMGVGIAAAAATQITPGLGSLAQRYLTTAIPFNLRIQDIKTEQDLLGRSALFVSLAWIEQ